MTTMRPWRIERWSKASGEITAKLRKNSGNQKKKKKNLQKTKRDLPSTLNEMILLQSVVT